MAKNSSKFTGMFDESPIEESNLIGRTGETGKVGRKPGKRSDPSYDQCSIFLKKANIKRARRILEDEYDGKKDLSTILNELLEKFNAEHSQT